MNGSFSKKSTGSAFTIVELLAATSVFIGLMLLLVTATNSTGDLWRRSANKIEQFQQARRGFESMTRRISQATLNTYWDYSYPLKNGKPDHSQVPTGYKRQSELRFRSGPATTLLGNDSSYQRPTHSLFFQAPLGFTDDESGDRVDKSRSHKPLSNVLNTWGYFVEIADDTDVVPNFLSTILPKKTRSRLMELMEPSEYLQMDNPTTEADPTSSNFGNVLDPNYDSPAFLDWFRVPVKKRTSIRVLSENILALVILPRLTREDELARANASPPKTETLCPFYDYDSKRLANNAAGIANPTVKASDPELNPKNQLPPVVTVAMVAIDEISAQHLIAGKSLSAAFDLGMKALFQDSSKLESSDGGDGDLAKLEKTLIDKKLTYRIFTSNVAIRGAKWSRSQQN